MLINSHGVFMTDRESICWKNKTYSSILVSQSIHVATWLWYPSACCSEMTVSSLYLIVFISNVSKNDNDTYSTYSHSSFYGQMMMIIHWVTLKRSLETETHFYFFHFYFSSVMAKGTETHQWGKNLLKCFRVPGWWMLLYIYSYTVVIVQ